ncbi:ras-related protein Rab-40C-like [Lampetra planeri]
MGTRSSPAKAFDYLLKVLLVGDSDVGKGEILASLAGPGEQAGEQRGAATGQQHSRPPRQLLQQQQQQQQQQQPPEHGPDYSSGVGVDCKTTTILLDGRRVKLQLWDTSGQGRFCTIFRSYSRGAQGILLVYDITSRWSFDGIDRWIKEIEEHAPGVPKVLVGNRLHLAFKRQVTAEQAQAYAERNGMAFFEVSPLCNFNVTESLTELSRVVLMRHGMDRLFWPNSVLSLQDLCCRAIVSCTPIHLVDKLPIPVTLRSSLKSFSKANGMNAVIMHGRSYAATATLRRAGAGKPTKPTASPPTHSCTRSNCKIS